MAPSRSRSRSSRSSSRSRSRSRSRSPASRSPRSRSRSRSQPPARDDERGATLWVANLPHDTTDARIKAFFGHWGTVLDVKIIYDPATGQPRGFGFVKFADSRDTEDAIKQADGKVFEGRPLKCNHAHGRQSHGPRGGYAPPARGGFRGGPAMRGRGGHYPPDHRMAGGYGPGGGWGHSPPGAHGPAHGPYNGGGYASERGGYAPRGRPQQPQPPAQRRRRSPSGSPGRYSPERFSPDSRRSPSPSQPPPRTRRRQRSPTATTTEEPTSPGAAAAKPAAAEPSTAAAPAAAPAPAPAKPSRKRAPSPTGSTSARSSGSSGSSDSERSPPPRDPPQLRGAPASAPAANDGAFRRTLVAARARESAEAGARTAALEAELEQSRAANGELQARLAAALKNQKRAEDSARQYRKWLVALADAARHATLGKESLRLLEAEFLAREHELSAFLREADDFLAADRGAKAARARDRQLPASGEAGGEQAPAAGSSNPTGRTDTTGSEEEVKLADLPAETPPAADKFKPGMKLRVVA